MSKNGSPDSRIMKTAGFKVIKVKYFDLAGIVPWFISLVWLKRTLTGAQVSLYDKFVVPIVKNLERMITPPIGKNLIIVAKKLP